MKLAPRILVIASVAVAGLATVAVAQPGRGSHGPAFGLLSLDANADGRLTRAEFDAAQKAQFNKIDANRDGSATPEEFKSFRDAEVEIRRSADLADRFAALDADGNGQVSRSEFIDGRAPDVASVRDGHAGPPRIRFDREPGGRMGPGGSGKMRGLGRADTDNNGVVSLDEFAARANEIFSRADANSDGTVTIAELQEARPARR